MHQGLSRCIRTILVFLPIALAQALFAQNSATSPSFQEQLEAQYPLAEITTSRGCMVSNADVAAVLVVQKPGVVGVRASSYAPKCGSNYKEYEKGNVSFEVAFGPALRIINWYVQPAGSARHIPQEFQNLP